MSWRNAASSSGRYGHRAVLAAGLALPGVASAHSGPPAILAYLMLGVAPLIVFMLMFLVYLPFSRFTGAQRMSLLSLSLGVAAVTAAVTYLLPDYMGYPYSFLMWLLPLIAVPLYARTLPRL